MSILSRYAKGKKESYTFPVMSRLSEETGAAFRAYCEKYNLSISEAVRLLIENEIKAHSMNELHREAAAADPIGKARMETEKMERIIPLDMAAGTAPAAQPAAKKASKGSDDREVVKPYCVKNEKGSSVAPCPICGTWSSETNFSPRHTKKHGFPSTAVFYDAYRDKLNEMYFEKTGKHI